MPEAVRSALAIAGKDLRLEFRTRTALLSAFVFAVLTLLVFNFSRDQSLISTTDLAPSALWITVAFGAVVAMNRAFIIEREQGAFDALLLAPVPRGAIYWGKFLANLAFVGTVECTRTRPSVPATAAISPALSPRCTGSPVYAV